MPLKLIPENRFIVWLFLVSSCLFSFGCNQDDASNGTQGNGQIDQSNGLDDPQFVSADLVPESAKKLQSIMLALQEHHDNQKRFPAKYSTDIKGKPLLSWRVHVLPYMGEDELYSEFRLDEAWDSSHNKKLIEKIPDVFRAPESTAKKGTTIFRGYGGLDGMFRRPSTNSHLGVKIAQVFDGTANTAMIVETNDSLAIEWTRPGAFPQTNEYDLSNIFGRYSDGTNLAFVDGSVRFISDATLPNQLLCYFIRNDGFVLRNFPAMIDQQKLEKQSNPAAFAQKVKQEIDVLKDIFKSSIELEILSRQSTATSAEELAKISERLFESDQATRNDLYSKFFTEDLVKTYTQ